jgi:hypothetical protein
MRLHQPQSHWWSDPHRARRKALPTVHALEGRALLAQVTVIPGMGTLVNLPLNNLPLSNLPLQSIGTASTTTVGRAAATRPTSGRTVSESLVLGRGGSSNVVAFPMPVGFSDLGRFLPAGAPSLVGTKPKHYAVPTRPQSHTVTPTAMPTPPPATSPAAPLAVGGHHGHHHHHH